MTLRRPAAHLRRPPSWRRSGDESYWESLMTEGEVLPQVSRPQRARRPQSAIEGGQLDSWLEHLERIQRELLTTPVHDTVLSDRTASVTSLNREPSTHVWRQQGIPSFSRGSSSCGTPSRCESSLGSQESLQTGILSPLERKGSWERARITHTPRKEQAQLSHLAPVKIGWLPIQRKVTMSADASKQNQVLDQSLGQVKLRQPITPTFRATNRHQDDEVERSHTSASALNAKTWQTPAQASPIIKQVPDQRSSAANEADRPGGWQALRRGWSINRLSSLTAGNRPNELPTGTGADPFTKPPLTQTTGTEPRPPLHRTTPAVPPCPPLRGSHSAEARVASSKTSGNQPARSPVNSSGPAQVQTTAAATTLVPQNRAGFSSITIASRRVSRSNSAAGAFSHSSNPREPMDQSSGQLMVQRKATIVKVTEQRMVSSPSTEREGAPPTSHALDTVVHRKKATIIKVTEHRESYSPAKERTRHPEYRHSYTEGVYKANSMWGPGNISCTRHLDSTSRTNAAPVARTSEKNGTTMHTSTLRLFVSSPPAIAAPSDAPPEVSLRPAAQRLNRPSRPASCYGSVSEPSKEIVTQPAARKWSFGFPQETDINPVNSCSSFIRPGTAEKEGGQCVADTLKPNRGEREILPLPEDAARRSSPGVTLIKAPDPHSHQSPEEVLALNAAAIIANIKLQRQLSKKKTPNGSSEKDPITSPRGTTVGDEQKRMKANHDEKAVCTQAVSPSMDPQRPSESISLQEALQRSKPHFISRSQGRVQRLEQRAKARRELAHSAARPSHVTLPQRGVHYARPTSHNGNLHRPRDTPTSSKDVFPRARHPTADMKKKKEEERRKETFQSNRQRLDVFKKKLLDQILQRGNN